MPKLQKEKTKKVIRYWRSGNIYPPNITDQLDKNRRDNADTLQQTSQSDIHPTLKPISARRLSRRLHINLTAGR